MKDVYYIDFDVDEVTSRINCIMNFKNIEGRIKLEDLKLNVIHHIESLRDDTAYIDELVQEDLLY